MFLCTLFDPKHVMTLLNNKDTLIHNHNLLEKYGNNRKYFEEKLIDILNNNIDFVYYDLIKEEKTYEIV